MKCVFIISLFFSVKLIAQTRIVPSVDANKDSQSEKWNLDEYVWSHTYPRPGTNDKPVLDFNTIDNQVSLSEQVSISPNGVYFVYGLQNNVQRRLDTVVVQSTVNNWRAVLTPDAQAGFFSADSKQYIFKDKAGLCFLQTGTGEHRYEKDIESYKTDDKKEWLAYRLANPENTLVLLQLATGREKRVNDAVAYDFDQTGAWLTYQVKDKQVVLQSLASGKEVEFENVTNYSFDESGTWLACQTDGPTKDLILHRLKDNKEEKFSNVQSYQFSANGDYLLLHTEKGLDYVNIPNAKRITIWLVKDSTESTSSESFDGTGKQVVFVIGSEVSFGYWKEGMETAEIKFSNQSPDNKKGLLIQGSPAFTDNGKYIRFSLQTEAGLPKIAAGDAVQLDMWSYKDRILQSAQPFSIETETHSAILYLETGEIIFPEMENEQLGMLRGDYAIIIKSGTHGNGDRFWENGYYTDSTWLLNLQTGVRLIVPYSKSNLNNWFSPDGKYLLYMDPNKECNYYSYELTTGKRINLSVGVPALQLGLSDPSLATPERPSRGSGIRLWLTGNKGLLVYDKYGDVWRLDPSGKKAALCITNGYGRSHNISFRLLNHEGDNQSFIGKDTLLLSAFNRKTKLQGFYTKVLGSKGDPEFLSMDPCYMMALRDGASGNYPLKAQGASTWIVNRESTLEAPNYCVTHDFKTFQQLTSLEPHKCYNWLTAELHSFKQLDGTISQGVLYKPQNFNPGKKYPLIISFYETLSDQRYHYPTAKYITAPEIFSDPVWMVSQGYLVFIPDVYFTKKQWGPSTMNTVDGAAWYLSQLPFVDGKHIGAAGHSNSGRFGYYLLTHSKSFAAISVGSGTTNAINMSLSLNNRTHESYLEWGEISAFGTGLGYLWQNKGSWLDQTSVLSADKVVAPLLQFHCKKDGVPVEQAVQMFTALRRLEKKVWWLQYDNGAHRVEGNDARDWTIRYTQYFDHYLKCAPAPRWMTQGIPYKLKGIEARYELDAAGSCAMQGKNKCAICEAWNKQYKCDTAMFSKPISEWKLDKDIEAEMNKAETKRYNDNMKGDAQRIRENNEKLKGTWKGEKY